MFNQNPISKKGAMRVARMAHMARVAAAAALAAMAWVSAAGNGVQTAAALTAAKSTPAKPTPQIGPNACKINGTLVVPEVDVAHTYGWSFVANFDHAASPSVVTTCLAERTYPGGPLDTKYTVGQQCTVVNNIGSPQAQFGGGFANFDGNAYLSCTLPVVETWPDLYWVRTRASLPKAGQSYTFLNSTNATLTTSFSGQTNGLCGLTLNSVYGVFSYSHSAPATCGTFMVVGSRLMRTSQTTQTGAHRIDSSIYGPVTNNTVFSLPANFMFNIGASGQAFTLDWFAIDPTPTRCCSPN